ncbi:hypothetical protein A1Q2_02665 [Trichosporon asahii var. asahii CBS 8904]|uniref:Uncharacterized protein n=1 Tax=Trichosporon asahii var. asahii (strain CBS 8904) TaxID=1220162 RepID=K1W2B5_TRIAC|nr:hypothetical protein A1Q2_02665 [Trichosporon asahii var. asahii CBS 8904]
MVSTFNIYDYPHIFALVGAYCDNETRFKLRLLCKAARYEINRNNDCHLLVTVVVNKLVLYSYKPDPDTRYLMPPMKHRLTRYLDKCLASPTPKIRAAFGYPRLIKVPCETLEFLYASYGRLSYHRKLGKKGSKVKTVALMPPPLLEPIREDCILELSHFAPDENCCQLHNSLLLPHVHELRFQYWREDRGGCTCASVELVHRATILRLSMNETTYFCGVVAAAFGPTVEELRLVVMTAESATAYLKTIKSKPRHTNLKVWVTCFENLCSGGVKRFRNEWTNMLDVPVALRVQEGGCSEADGWARPFLITEDW